MKCDRARELLSVAHDETLPARDASALAAHVDGCGTCASFRDDLDGLRRKLRIELATPSPDVAPVVVARVAALPKRSSRVRLLPVAAAFFTGVIAGGVLVAVNRPGTVSAATLPARWPAAAQSLQSVTADVVVKEAGLHPAVPVRDFAGVITYSAPESFALHLVDRTRYPNGSWPRGDVDVVVAGPSSWTRAVGGCPRALLPGCLAPARASATTGREPFDRASPPWLDAVIPVTLVSAPPTDRRLRIVMASGRRALEWQGTAADAGPLLASFTSAGNWRDWFAGDAATVTFDAAWLLPVHITVRAASGPDRRAWAAARGYRDAEASVLLDIALSHVQVNQLGTSSGKRVPHGPPADAQVVDRGFLDDAQLPAGSLAPVVPAGFGPYRRGHRVGGVDGTVQTWVRGRAWIGVESTRQWRGPTLFGDVGAAPQPIRLPDGATAYRNSAGDRIAIHGDGIDAVVAGNAPLGDLVSVAASLGVASRPVPSSWEGEVTTHAAARRAHRGLLFLPDGFGFRRETVRARGATVILDAVGAGQTSVEVVEYAGDTLPPPDDPDARGIRVRGHSARYLPAVGELAWAEHGTVVAIRSMTLPVTRLVALAEGMHR